MEHPLDKTYKFNQGGVPGGVGVVYVTYVYKSNYTSSK